MSQPILITDRVNSTASMHAAHSRAQIVYVDPYRFFDHLSNAFIEAFGDGSSGEDVLIRLNRDKLNEFEKGTIVRLYYNNFVSAVNENQLNGESYRSGVDLERVRNVVFEDEMFEDHFVFGIPLKHWLEKSGITSWTYRVECTH